MTSLTEAHIGFIIKDLHAKGLILESLHDELIDHICSAVEDQMNEGVRFRDAYDSVLGKFGNITGILDTQETTLRFENLTSRNMGETTSRLPCAV